MKIMQSSCPIRKAELILWQMPQEERMRRKPRSETTETYILLQLGGIMMCSCRGKAFYLTSWTTLPTHRIHQNTCIRRALKFRFVLGNVWLVFFFLRNMKAYILKAYWVFCLFICLVKTERYLLLIDIFTILFFWPYPQHAEIPGPGFEAMPHSQAEPLQWQLWILNPLSHEGTPSY